VRARAFERRTPSDLMERVNRTLRRKGIEGLFCTLAYALFDFQDRSLRLANSGLPHPLHYRAALGRAVPLEVSGLPLGTFDGVVYDELRAALEPGDAFVFYSDGVIEARSGKEEYGPERLSRGLEAAASGSATEIGTRLIRDLEQFLGAQSPHDDITLIVLKIL
jgi:sigma-B regulation protein RsbU (phosphoserine phosphatase)